MDEMKYQSLSDQVKRCEGRYDFIRSHITATKTAARDLKKEKVVLEKAKAIIQKVAKETQSQLQCQVSSLVTMGMNSIFDDPYEMKLEFVERRNKTEVDVYFERDGIRIDPISCSGGGAVDIASLALQICLLSIQKKKKQMILILDEPLKHLKGNDMPEKGAELIHSISEKLGIQVIMVSHDPALISEADKVFSVKIRNGISEVKEIKS